MAQQRGDGVWESVVKNDEVPGCPGHENTWHLIVNKAEKGGGRSDGGASVSLLSLR